jgi:hypothetical protein
MGVSSQPLIPYPLSPSKIPCSGRLFDSKASNILDSQHPGVMNTSQPFGIHINDDGVSIADHLDQFKSMICK